MGYKIDNIKRVNLFNTWVVFLLGFFILSLIFTELAVSGDQGVMHIIKNATKKLDSDVQFETSIMLPKHVVMAHENFQGGIFYTEARKNRIDRFKCSSCHDNKEVMIQNPAKISNADIVLGHGRKDGPENCNTCHDPKNRDYLTSAKGEPIDMDHAYDMCGQCHFRQKKDWIGGAHGKRVTFWAGKRVIKNCTSCHNPHSPRFEKRMPATYSVPLK